MYFSLQNRVCPVKGSWANQHRLWRATSKVSLPAHMWTPHDSFSQWWLLKSSCLHEAETHRQPFLRSCAQTRTVSSMLWYILCPEALSIWLGRKDKDQPKLNYKRSSSCLVGELSLLSLSFPLFCLLFSTKGSWPPLTTVISPRTKRKGHWLIHIKVYRTTDVHPYSKEVHF